MYPFYEMSLNKCVFRCHLELYQLSNGELLWKYIFRGSLHYLNCIKEGLS